MTALRSPSLDPVDDAGTVSLLWDDFATRLRGFIASRVSNQADVDDILQEVFIKIQRGAGQLRDDDRLTAWMFRIANNAIIDHYRSAPRRRELPVDTFRDEEGHPGVDERIDDPAPVRAQVSACLLPLIQQLPEHYRQALEIVELGGTSQTDAARHLGLSVSGMKSRVQRARSQLLDRLSELCALTVDARGAPIDCVPAPDSSCG